MDQQKLLQLLRQDNVKITTKGNISLYDLVEKIIKSKNSKLYIKRLTDYDKILVNGNEYISPKDCITILKTCNFKKCKEIYTKIQMNDGGDSSIIDVDKQIFQFEGYKFMAFFVDKYEGDWDVWVRGSEVAKFLLYKNPSEAVKDNVDNGNKVSFEKICKLFPERVQNINLSKKTMFINYDGLVSLIIRSKKPKAIRFAIFLNVKVIYKKTYHEQSIMNCLIEYFDSSHIKYFNPYSVMNMEGTFYFIDCYLPEYNIAIEIDENNHKDRCPKYEKNDRYLLKKNAL